MVFWEKYTCFESMIVISLKRRFLKQRTCTRTFLPHLAQKANQKVTCDMAAKRVMYALSVLFYQTPCSKHVVYQSNGNIVSVKWLGRKLGCWGNCTIWTKVSRRKLCEDVSYLSLDNVNKLYSCLPIKDKYLNRTTMTKQNTKKS